MNRPAPIDAARELVAARYPHAREAWLSGSVVLGGATETSDLDITVLLDQVDVHRESLLHDSWPVELFVHTESSVRHFVAQDQARRRPTMARLVSTGLPLVAAGNAEGLRDECAEIVAAGPGPLPAAELSLARYHLTDLLDDLAGGGPAAVQAAVAVEVWRHTAELVLARAEWWGGSGKWLVRELEACDEATGTDCASRLHAGLRAALGGDPAPLMSTADEVLAAAGGRLWAGFYLEAALPGGD